MLTIGHSILPIELFLKALAENEVRMLVDIRTVPRSRHNPQFSQELLPPALGAHAISYRWMRSLGGLRRAAKDSQNGGWRNTSFRGYADYMQTPEFADAIGELLSIAREVRTVIMCAEALPWRCHRSLVGDAALIRGVAVEDIFVKKNGESERKPHTLTSFAHVDGLRLWYPPEAERTDQISLLSGM